MSVVWDSIKADLRGTMTAEMWGQIIRPTTATEAPGRLVVHHPDRRLLSILQNRYSQQISQVAETHQPGLSIDFINGSQATPDASNIETQPQKIEADGYYQHAYTAIVQPDKIEAFSQYFRWHWRPLLGPVLSELIRELRQMCYLGKGHDQIRRNTAEVTQHELARRLGVSLSTVQRYLRRDRYGKFIKNPHLNKFILDVEIITKYDDEKRKVVNDRTRFTISIDEPIAPDDEAEYTKLSKRQNDT